MYKRHTVNLRSTGECQCKCRCKCRCGAGAGAGGDGEGGGGGRILAMHTSSPCSLHLPTSSGPSSCQQMSSSGALFLWPVDQSDTPLTSSSSSQCQGKPHTQRQCKTYRSFATTRPTTCAGIIVCLCLMNFQFPPHMAS